MPPATLRKLAGMFPRAGARASCAVPLVLLFLTLQTAHAASGPFTLAMESAAQSRGVPLAVVEATAYVNTRWEWINTPSVSGVVGQMDIGPSQMGLATSLSGHTETEINADPAANLDAGAALLAHYHTYGTDLSSWKSALVIMFGPRVADEIFTVMRYGASRETSTGEDITLAPQSISTGTGGASSVDGGTSTATVASSDYPAASWVAASSSNYTVANRPHDYPIDMIVIHDIEGSASSAIQTFQDPNRAASSHYGVGYEGAITQMVREKDIAWHAGNWDYNTRAIGIEHAGFAYTPGLYTTAEYNASAALAASICSRYGVPMDRTHVIGHYQVPDPYNPGLYGGYSHHTDPGPYWNWTYYMARAQVVAASLPSPPHLMPDPVATNTATGVTVTWKPARTCHTPISGYTVTGQPGGLSVTVPAAATSATFDNLQLGTRYTFTVTAINSDGQDSETTNSAIPGACRSATLTSNQASPQLIGTSVRFSFGSTTCANPRYQLWMLAPGGSWTVLQPYSTATSYTWRTTGLAYGTYSFAVWARDTSSPGVTSSSGGTYDDREGVDFRLVTPPCTATTVTVSPATGAMRGTVVTLSASTTGCSNPEFEFWVDPPGGPWGVVQAYSATASYIFNTASRPVGFYYFSVWTRDAGSDGRNGTYPNSYDSFYAFPYTVSFGCPVISTTSSPSSSASLGTPVTISATATGCPNPRYEFWLLPPGGIWQIVQGYSSKSTYTLSTTGRAPGLYRFSVWVRDASRSVAYDTYSAFDYSLSVAPCTSMTATSSPASTATIGTSVTISGAATGCPNPRYQFWLMPPGGSWTVVRAYGAGSSFTWSTASKAAGTYRFSVWARDASSTASYDTFQAFQYSLTVTPCTGMTASATPSTAMRGTTVAISGVASGCANPQYAFWILPPGGTWTLAQAYFSSATFAWNSTNKPAGVYRFSVWARDTSSPGTSGTAPNTYDAFNSFQFTLT